MILVVQIQNFDRLTRSARKRTRAARQRVHIKVLIFQKNSRGPKYQYFCESWHEASFYFKKQMHKYKLKILVFITTFLDPPKSAFLVFKEKPPNIFSLCFNSDSALNTINAQMFFSSVFLKMHQKKSKMPFGPFLAAE